MEQVLSPADDRAPRRMSALGLALIVLAFLGRGQPAYSASVRPVRSKQEKTWRALSALSSS
jgi:hypothetical protein